jgi:hypothetical protein
LWYPTLAPEKRRKDGARNVVASLPRKKQRQEQLQILRLRCALRMEALWGGCGIPPLRQKKGAKMGHGMLWRVGVAKALAAKATAAKNKIVDCDGIPGGWCFRIQLFCFGPRHTDRPG